MTNNTDDDDVIETYSEYKAKKMMKFLNSKQEQPEKPTLRSEKLEQAMRSNWLELHNTYKSYEAVPPQNQYKKIYDKNALDLAKAQEHVYEAYDMKPSEESNDSKGSSSSCSSSISPKPNDSNKSNLKRAPSLDSLINSSASDSSMDDQNSTHSDSDSGADLSHLFPSKRDNRFSEMSDMINKRHSEICKAEFNEVYHEKVSKRCSHKNSEPKDMDTKINFAKLEIKEKKAPFGPLNAGLKPRDLGGSMTSLNSRKFSSFSTGSSGPMETIIEEASEPKVSVKEILARFETMSEKSELQQKVSPSRGLPPVGGNQSGNVMVERQEISQSQTGMNERNARPSLSSSISPGQVSPTSQESQTKDAKHSLLQFAVNHFRQSPELDALKTDTLKGSKHKNQQQRGEWTWKRQTDLVKWQSEPLRGPLLRLRPPELAALAIDCFMCVLRYCGDAPPPPATPNGPPADLSEVKCVYTVLMHCHKFAALRDEVYCQLMKQTTSNKSPNPESCQRAWRLMSIVAAYFNCSDTLKPYLLEYLTSAAGDRRRHCQGTAAVCLANLRKTSKCGGRKNVPSVEEVTAVSAGRSARRQIYRLPGGAERVVNTRCSTVVQDVIHDLCDLIGVNNEAEQAEFSLYCIVQGDAFTMPLAADEYILDVTTELQKAAQPFYLIFCRSVWYHPLRHDASPLYTEVLFNQVAPDYLEGLLLELPGGGRPSAGALRDMALVAALLHRAADLNHPPHLKEIKFLLPKPVLGLREIKPAKWAALVQADWSAAQPLSTHQAKAQVLAVLSQWPLFGSSFFAVKRVAGGGGSPSEWRDHILALNRRGVHFLDVQTHETIQHWPFAEVISTRKVRSEDGSLFLDMKCGSLLQQRVTRLQTEQAHEVSRLVRQYITLQQSGANAFSSD